jgi:DNA-binding NarL/FixJ family response regulator
MITVLVVDDHSIVRAGLRRILSAVPGVSVVGEASDGLQALSLVAELAPDVILMDVSMPVMDGIVATRRILEDRPGACVLALTFSEDHGHVAAMVDAGARGYLLKDTEPDELVRSLEAAVRGHSPLAPSVASALMARRRAETEGALLRPREREILGLLAAGLTNRAIAVRLGVTEATVKAHLTRAYVALGVSDRITAAARARELGLGPLTD